MWLSRRGLILGTLALAACGFTPAYGPGGAASKLQDNILVDAPGDGNAYRVTRRIEERMGAGGPNAPYKLGLSLKVQSESLGSTADGDINRYQVVGALTYALRYADGTGTIDTGTVRNFASYSASGSTAATLAAQRDAQDRLMLILADQVVERLVLASPDL